MTRGVHEGQRGSHSETDFGISAVRVISSDSCGGDVGILGVIVWSSSAACAGRTADIRRREEPEIRG